VHLLVGREKVGAVKRHHGGMTRLRGGGVLGAGSGSGCINGGGETGKKLSPEIGGRQSGRGPKKAYDAGAEERGKKGKGRQIEVAFGEKEAPSPNQCLFGGLLATNRDREAFTCKPGVLRVGKGNPNTD